MKMYSKGFLTIFLLASVLGLSACKQEGTAERAEQNGDQALEQTGDRTTYQTGQDTYPTGQDTETSLGDHSPRPANHDRTMYQTEQNNNTGRQAGEMSGTQSQEQVYGSQLMTNDERTEYQAKMRAAQTEEEREFLRTQHHQSMQERAEAQGMTLPDAPPTRGGGMGMGRGPAGGGMMQGGDENP